MDGIKYGNVQTLLAVDNPLLRKGLHEALRHAGFCKLVDAATTDQLHRLVREAVFDLIIMTAEMQSAHVGHVVANIRNGRVEHHPFPLTILLLAAGHRDYVVKAIDCGPDDMLLMPVSPGQLLSRIEVLVRGRKPFVVTQDFTGPDRRQEWRPGGMEISLIDVPNPLKERVNNTPQEVLQEQISMAAKRLHQEKLERYIFQIHWLVDAINTLVNSGEADPAKLTGHTKRLLQIADDLPNRMAGSFNADALRSGLSACAGAILGILPKHGVARTGRPAQDLFQSDEGNQGLSGRTPGGNLPAR